MKFLARKAVPVLGLVALAALAEAPASAQTFTVTLTGHLTSVNGPFDSSVQAGTSFTESLTWDQSIPIKSSSSDTKQTIWETSDYTRAATITFGNVVIKPYATSNQALFSRTPPDYYIQTREANYQGNGKPDSINFISEAAASSGAPANFVFASAIISLVNSTSTPTLSLTNSSADWLDTFSGSEFVLQGIDNSTGGYEYLLDGVVTGVTEVPAPSPEPSTWVSLAVGSIGLTGLMLKARKRKTTGTAIPDA